ncbi:MAG TPA: acetate--CoA ligase family protein, partial [Candidatus Binataceae bacterium]|nr:acetate--CoA ligase family protein [Candidatus Binataceae bacterium]
ERGIGFSFLISTGNEAVVDISECIDFLAQDQDTQAICLLVETIRRPQAFFESARRAQEAGKPIVALKNGRSRRGREIATSHTGAMTDEAWIYEAAFKQYGIAIARDLVELMDRVVLFDQIPPARWPAARGLAVVSGSGGWAAMAGDLCEEEKLALPVLSSLHDRIARVIPEVATVNPLDLTGAAMTRPQILESVLEDFAGCPEVDAMVVLWPVVAETLRAGNAFVEPARKIVALTDKLVMISSIEGGQPGPFAGELIKEGIGVGRGLRSTLRAIKTTGDFVRHRARQYDAPAECPALPHPDASAIASPAGPMLSFSDTMAMLAEAGIPIAPFVVIKGGAPVAADAVEFNPPFVVKLADVPHRTQIDAVRQWVPAADLARVISELRLLAAHYGSPADIVVQPQLKFDAELFMGVKTDTALGPIAVCGVGGILVEFLKTIAGLLAPFTLRDAEDLLAELEDTGMFAAGQTKRRWERSELADILVKVGHLGVGARAWMSSLDINPLGFGANGFVAVDGLCILRTPSRETAST